VLDREETAALAEIEAALRREDPELVSMLETFRHAPTGLDPSDFPSLGAMIPLDELLADAARADDEPLLVAAAGPDRRWRRRLSALVVTMLAIAVTLAVTVAWGPDAGGLTGVIATMAATMYGYQVLRGCPGRR
jgi:hypothetical protein